MKSHTAALAWLLSGLLPILTGCVGSTPPAAFYLLEPANAEKPDAYASESSTTVVLMPVRVPRYLERPQIVIAEGENRYRLDELNRWAEALDDNMTRVMVQALSSMVPAHVVAARTQNASAGQLRLSVTVLAFHVDSRGQAQLVAQWQLADESQMLARRQMTYGESVGGDAPEHRVAALNRCFNRFNRDIADSITAIIKP